MRAKAAGGQRRLQQAAGDHSSLQEIVGGSGRMDCVIRQLRFAVITLSIIM